MILVVGAKGTNLSRVRAAMVGVFATVTNQNSVLFEVRRCGTIKEGRATVICSVEGVIP